MPAQAPEPLIRAVASVVPSAGYPG